MIHFINIVNPSTKRGLQNVIDSIENSRTPLAYFVFSFLFVLTTRNYIEAFPGIFRRTPIMNLHFNVWFSVVAAMLILFFHFATGQSVTKVAKVVLSSFLIILSPPVFDFVLSGGRRFEIRYLSPNNDGSFWGPFFTFLKTFPEYSPGIRLEIVAAIIGSLLYIWAKTQRVFRAVFCGLFVYIVIFANLAAPYWIKWVLELFGTDARYDSFTILSFYWAIGLFVGTALLWRIDRATLKGIICDIRLTRLLHYELLFLLGTVLTFNRANDTPNPVELAAIFFTAIAIAFAWIYSVMTNNETDLEIDKVSNPNRPLVTNKVNRENYRLLTWVMLGLALSTALIAGYHVFSSVIFFIGSYYVYSMPPFRLKRVPFFSKLVIAGNSFAMLVLGLAMGRFYPPDVPTYVAVLFLAGFTCGINFIDLKDFEGDKQAGILTIPVLLGMRRAQRILGLSFLAGYAGSIVVLRTNMAASGVMALLGALQFYFLNRKQYNERPVMALHVLTLALVIVYVVVTKHAGVWN